MTKSELCLQCMKCCTFLSFEVENATGTLEFYRARGIKLQLFAQFNPPKVFVSIPHKCPKLTHKGCSIYEKRPYQCRIFDGSTSLTTKNLCLWNEGDKHEN